jgi:hypothetical protein
MFHQDTPPDTSAYMIAGYTIFFIVMAVYLLSLVLRSRNLRRDMAMLESLKPAGPPVTTQSPVPQRPRAGRATRPRKAAGAKAAIRKKK